MRKLFVLLCTFALLLSACGGQKSKEIKLAEVGRNVNLSLNEGVKFLRDAHDRKLIADAPYATALGHIRKIQIAADRANERLDALAVLDTTNSIAVVEALDDIVIAVQDALDDPNIATLSPDMRLRVANILTGFSLSVNLAKTIVASLQKPTPTASIKFQFQGVN